MTIKLEVGKKYRNRLGEVIKITKHDHGHKFPFGCYIDDENTESWYMANGRYFIHREDANDLIEEVIEPQEPVKKPHKHSELIKLWADGAEIETYCHDGLWKSINDRCAVWSDKGEYRIKPAPKPDVVIYKKLENLGGGIYRTIARDADNLKLIFDGETGALKEAKVISHDDAVKMGGKE